MSNAIIPMINSGSGDVAISDAVIANIQSRNTKVRALCVQAYSCDHNFIGCALIPSKCITIDFNRESLIAYLCRKIVGMLFKILECIRLYSSKETENKDLVADYLLGVDQNPRYDTKIYEICKKLHRIRIFLPQSGNYQCREIEFI